MHALCVIGMVYVLPECPLPVADLASLLFQVKCIKAFNVLAHRVFCRIRTLRKSAAAYLSHAPALTLPVTLPIRQCHRVLSQCYTYGVSLATF